MFLFLCGLFFLGVDFVDFVDLLFLLLELELDLDGEETYLELELELDLDNEPNFFLGILLLLSII